MKYKRGYKYQLAETFKVTIPITGETIKQGFIRLTTTGILTLDKGYAWDGPSGPAIDTKNFMRGSLVHDALYQLMRMGRLKAKSHRNIADRLLQTHCLEDGMWRVRAWWVYRFVVMFAAPAANPKYLKETLTAP